MRIASIRGLLRRRVVIIVLVIGAILLTIRMALPIFVVEYVNQVINDIPDMQGSVQDVDLHLWRSAYTVHGLEINLVNSGKLLPLMSAETVELSIEWRALLDGALVGELRLYRAQAHIVAGAEKKGKSLAQALAERFIELWPLRINRFVVHDGALHFRNFAAQPDIDIYLDQVYLEGSNLTNSKRLSENLVATVDGRGRAMNSGQFSLAMKLDPSEKRPTYELAFELKDLRLPELNSFLKHYLAVDARDGRFSVYIESIGEQGKFKGYVKPVVHDLNVLHIKQEKKTVAEFIKGFFLKIIEIVIENKPQQQLASKIEFSGSFDNPDINIWSAISSLLRNGFVQPLEPVLEGSIAPIEVERAKRK